MKIVTSKELAKEPNGSLIWHIGKDREICFDKDQISSIFIGQYGNKNDREAGHWNGMVYLYPFLDDNPTLEFTEENINSGKDICNLSRDDIVFNVDTDNNDYDKDELFAIYSEEEKQNFVREIIDCLGYSISDLKKILDEEE